MPASLDILSSFARLLGQLHAETLERRQRNPNRTTILASRTDEDSVDVLDTNKCSLLPLWPFTWSGTDLQSRDGRFGDEAYPLHLFSYSIRASTGDLLFTIPPATSLSNLFASGATFECRVVLPDNSLRLIANKTSSTLGWTITRRSSGQLQFTHTFSGNDGTWLTNSTVPIGRWVHIAITYNGSLTTNDPTIYMDGQIAAITETSSPTGTIDSESSGYIDIGLVPGNLEVDEVRYWNVIRTQSEIVNNLNKEISGSLPSALKGYWKCNEGTGTVVGDSTTNNNHGSLGSNAVWSLRAESSRLRWGYGVWK